MKKIKSLFIKPFNKMFYLLITIIVLSITACNKPIPFAFNIYPIEKNISYQRGIIKLIDENIQVRYLITNYDENNNDSGDIIFFFHGIGRNEYQWIDNNGFEKQFLEAVHSDNNFKNIPVISISFGMASLIINDIPYPFDANLESIFINELIPYFKKLLNKNGKIYLIGHSMGGYNALSLAFRHSDLFPVVIAISPFIPIKSPFKKNFEKKINNSNKDNFFLIFLKKTLKYTFKDEKNWNKYNFFNKITKANNNDVPYIIISSSDKDIPEFSYSIKVFLKKMQKEKINYKYFLTPGSHQKPKIENLIVSLMKRTIK